MNDPALSALMAASVFRELGEHHRARLLAAADEVRLAAGQTLFCEGDAFDGAYLIASGAVRVRAGAAGAETTLALLGPGDVVGEMQLLTGGPRSASAFASEPSRLLKIPQAVFRSLASEHPALLAALSNLISLRLHHEQLARTVRRLFGALEPAVIEALRQEVEWVPLAPGETLFEEGDPGDALYALIDGRLVAWAGHGQDRRRIGEVVAGETVGEIAMISGEPRSATIQAAKRSLLIRLARPQFEEFAARFPAVYKAFAEVIVRRLRRSAGERVETGVAREIAVLPHRCDASLVVPFASRLARGLAALGPTLHLCRASLEAKAGEFPFDIREALGLPLHDARNARFALWLREQRQRHRFILYEADPATSAWTRMALEQADEVLVVARANDAPEPGPVESLLPAGSLASRRLVLVQAALAVPTGTRAWLELRQGAAHHHLRENREGDYARIARFLAGRAIGLVLAGGGAKGFAHIGVLKALHESGLPVDVIGGTSSGGMAALAYAMDLDPARLAERNKTGWVDRRPDRKYAPPVLSFLDHTKWDRIFQEGFGAREVEDLWIPAFCISCNIDAGRTVVHDSGPVWKAVRATASLPALLAPLLIDGQAHVDGGVVNNLPTDVMRARTRGLVFAVSLGSRREQRLLLESYPSPWRLLVRRFLPGWRRLSAHTVPRVMLQLATLGDLADAHERAALADYVLRPPVKEFSLMDFERLDAIVRAGYEHTLAQLGELQRDEAFVSLLRAAGIELRAPGGGQV
jgi:NTE family protein/lysophospholipid hydrolase